MKVDSSDLSSLVDGDNRMSSEKVAPINKDGAKKRVTK
jgi:hypothetical protein